MTRKETFNRNNIITFGSLFLKNNLLIVSIKSHFVITISSRSQMKMVLYLKDTTEKATMYIYDGVNHYRLDELWECNITSSKGYDIDLSFYWKQVLINGFALSCFHSVCLYKDQLIFTVVLLI